MKYLNFVVAILLVLVYSSATIPPSERFNLWIVTFLIPFASGANILLILVGLVYRKKSTLFLLAALFFGGNYLLGTIGIKSFFKGKAQRNENAFSVLNYNLSAFNTGYYKGMGRAELLKADSIHRSMISWVVDTDVDIKCFQEFPHNPAANFDLLKEFETRGYSHYYSQSGNGNDAWLFGIVIVSRFPIVSSGDVLVSKNGFNRVAYADVQIGRDTMRIINVHLQSMQMKAFHPGYSEDFEDQKRNVKVVLRKLKSGVFERSRQIAAVVKFIEASPYPVICVGDFNEMPYSYSYGILKRHLKNSFEESGKGFGFTYNGNTMTMLRIDNQFYSESITCTAFQTLDAIEYTDHFPLLGKYSFP